MLIVDRIEENMAIIETEEETIEIPIKYLPERAREGDILRIVIDKDNTEKRKEGITNLADSLFE